MLATELKPHRNHSISLVFFNFDNPANRIRISGETNSSIQGASDLTVSDPRSSNLSDEALLAQILQRDQQAFALLYDRYAQPIYALAVHLLGSPDAEEVVQDVFLRLWKRAGQFDISRGSFKAWFMTMARNRMLDELRRRGQQYRLRVVEDIQILLENAHDPQVDVEQQVRRQEDSRLLLSALKRLPPEQRQVLIMAYFGGLSQSAIAKQLGWPLGTVKKRTRLGMQKLKVALTPPAIYVGLSDERKDAE